MSIILCYLPTILIEESESSAERSNRKAGFTGRQVRGTTFGSYRDVQALYYIFAPALYLVSETISRGKALKHLEVLCKFQTV